MAITLFKYTLREIIWPVLASLLALTFILLTGLLYDLLELVLHPGVTGGELLRIILPILPSLLVFATPMAILIGVLIGVGRMVMDREVLALRTSGVNLFMIFIPIMFCGLLVSLFLLGFSTHSVPRLLQHGAEQVARLQFKLVSSLDPGVVHDALPGIGGRKAAIYFRERDEETGEMVGIVLELTRKLRDDKAREDMRDSEITLFLAERGVIEAGIGEDSTMGALALKMRNGTIHHLDPDPLNREYMINSFDRFEKYLQRDSRIEKRHKTMTNGEIRDQLDELRATSEDEKHRDEKIGLLRREYFERLSIAWASFVFMIVGIPLAIQIRAAGKSWSILIAIGLMVIYYILMKFGLAMVEEDRPFGVLMAFAPNFLYALLGAGLWWQIQRS